MHKLIKFSDLALIVSIALFSFIALNENNLISTRVVSGVLCITLIINLIGNIVQRNKMFKIDTSKSSADIETEDELRAKNRILYNDIRSKALEKAVAKYLSKTYKDARIFSNIKIIKSDGSETEIDVLAIINKKIFVIECKNYAVEISGDWNDDYLMAKYKSPININNPVKQNQYHIEHLSKLLMADLSYYGNIVVFGDQTSFPHQQPPKYTMICKLGYLDKPIKFLNIKQIDEDTYNEVVEVLGRIQNINNKKKNLE